MLSSWVSSSTTKLNIPAFGLRAGYTYVLQATYTSVLDPLVKVGSNTTLITQAVAPVALFTTAGGTYTRDFTLVLNASSSYDPNCATLEATWCSAALTYAYGCYYTDTGSSCDNFQDVSSLLAYPSLAALAPSDYAFELVFTLDVYNPQTQLSGSTSITIYVLPLGAPYVTVLLQTVPSTMNPTDKLYFSGMVENSSAAALTVRASHVTGSPHLQSRAKVKHRTASTVAFSTTGVQAVLPANALASFMSYAVTLSVTADSVYYFSLVSSSSTSAMCVTCAAADHHDKWPASVWVILSLSSSRHCA
jgi:hypothetical protein